MLLHILQDISHFLEQRFYRGVREGGWGRGGFASWEAGKNLEDCEDEQSSHWMAYTEKTSILFPFKLNLIWSWWQFSFRFWAKLNPFGSKSKGKLSPRSYPIQCERKGKYSFLSVVWNYNIAVVWCRRSNRFLSIDLFFIFLFIFFYYRFLLHCVKDKNSIKLQIMLR